VLIIQTLFQDADLPSSFSFFVAAGAGIHSNFLLWLLTGPYLHLLLSHFHYLTRKIKYSTKLLTFWNDKKYFVQRFELVSKEHYLRFNFIELNLCFQTPKTEQEWLAVAEQ
jgi:hypothetical protein